MIKLTDYIKLLQKLEEKGYGEFPCVYSIDDEGNSYDKVIFEPNVAEFDDIEPSRGLGLSYEEDGETPGNNYNAVIIN